MSADHISAPIGARVSPLGAFKGGVTASAAVPTTQTGMSGARDGDLLVGRRIAALATVRNPVTVRRDGQQSNAGYAKGGGDASPEDAGVTAGETAPGSQANAVAEAEGTITAQPPKAETVSRVAPGRTGDGVMEAGAAHFMTSDAGSQADDAAGGVTVGGDESGTAASLSPSPAIPSAFAVWAPSTAQGSAGFLPARPSLPLSPSGGMIRLIARDGFRVAPPLHGTVVSDPLGRPNSRRPRGASVAHGGLMRRLGVSPETRDCRSLRAPALLNSYRHGRALPSAPVRERDGCAPDLPGCATVASLLAAAPGSPAGNRLVSLRARSCRQAVGGRALVPCRASPIDLTGSR